MSAAEELLVVESNHIRPTVHRSLQTETSLECS